MQNDFELLTESFIEAVCKKNNHKIRSLLHPESVYTSPLDQQISGTENILHFWSERFVAYPDFFLEKTDFFLHNETAFLTAFVSAGSHYFPMAVKLDFTDNQISGWQEFSPVLPENKSKKNPAAAVAGIGGVFFRSPDPQKLIQWYDTHLGTGFGKNTYLVFRWRQREDSGQIGSTTFSIFPDSTAYFSPSSSSFMLNFRVADLDGLLQELEKNGIQSVGKIEEFEYGRFAWIMDPDGNKIELWEPGDETVFDND